MADNADILGQLYEMQGEQVYQSFVLDSIDNSVKELLKVCKDMSISNMSNMNRRDPRWGNPYNIRNNRNSQGFGFNVSSFRNSASQYRDAFKEEILKEVLGADFRDKIKGVFDKLASDMGVEVSEISSEFGKEAGKRIINSIKESPLGSAVMDTIKSTTGDIFKGLANSYTTAQTTALASGASATSAAFSGVTAAAATASPYILLAVGAVVAATAVISKMKEALGPAIDGAKAGLDALKKSANRYSASQKENIELAKKRLEADVRTMVEAPFKILEEAAQKWYDTWDNNLRVINGTQGYNKDELQALMGSFADRLRQEKLTDVVSSADITDNLAKVLESGLSGTVAEEFAYLATKLNAAIPTQDFFSFADSYASVAANAIREGKSQSEAISYANAQLELFASNLLYTGREVVGGFTTGLKNAENIFAQSVQIAQAAKTNNATEIAGVMTAVSAITGAIAPDLANSMTDAIYNAAVGGNSSEIVALRSLAGINASNTEFLKQLTKNPKEVFVNLFNELAKRQNMSSDAYMEVAEGLSSIFGISMDAFARVDFAYLAQAIASMNTTNSSLSDNMALLVSGETTTNAELLKVQQINKYMLDEGLAYVLDNQAARSIQEHMWDEQIARELMEATYGVELEGAALKFLEGIRETVDNILGFLNPFKLIGKLVNLAATVNESSALKADIAGLLEAGKVGTGTANAKFQLTTRNRDLDLTDNIVNLMGGNSQYESIAAFREGYNTLTHLHNTYTRGMEDLIACISAVGSTIGSNEFSGKSVYQWKSIGKSVANSISASIPSGKSMSSEIAKLSQSSILSSTSNTGAAQIKANENIQKMLDSMSDFVTEDKEHKYTYDDWLATAKTFGISDFQTAVENAGLTVESVKGQYDMLQTQIAGQEKLEREKREEKFWENNTDLLTKATEWLESINTHTENLFKKFENYFKEWTRYFIDHEVYNSTFTHEQYDKIARQEKESSETAIYALADALTQNDVKLLLDPTVQTNALLAQILKVAVAILEQSKDSGVALSLPDTIAGLSLGIVK